MAQTILDPEIGRELATGVVSFMDGEMLELAQGNYNAVKSLGEDNHIVEAYKEGFNQFQNYWNNSVVPVFTSLRANFEEFTNMAEFVQKKDIDTKVADVDMGEVRANNYDAIAAL